MDGCIYRTQFNLCEKNKEEDEKRGILRWCDFEGCEDKHPSNADRVRAMTDEELSVFLDDISNGCDNCPKRRYCLFDTEEENCCDAYLKWLKEEVEDGSN